MGKLRRWLTVAVELLTIAQPSPQGGVPIPERRSFRVVVIAECREFRGGVWESMIVRPGFDFL